MLCLACLLARSRRIRVWLARKPSRNTMRITQTCRNEKKPETCTDLEPGCSSIAGMVIKTCGAVAVLVAVMVGMPFSSLADDPPLVYPVENSGASSNYPAPPLPTFINCPVIQPLPDPFCWANDPMNKNHTRSSKPRSRIMRLEASRRLLCRTFLPATRAAPLRARVAPSQCVQPTVLTPSRSLAPSASRRRQRPPIRS